jgi:hypothetical protein
VAGSGGGSSGAFVCACAAAAIVTGVIVTSAAAAAGAGFDAVASVSGEGGSVAAGTPASAAVMRSSDRCAPSSVEAVGPLVPRFHPANKVSSDWHNDSMSWKSAARAAPFRLCTARNTVSITGLRAAASTSFSS